MIGKLKKPLIYLLAIMLVLPTWLAVGVKSATKAKANYNAEMISCIDELEITNRVFSPNSDGVKDQSTIDIGLSSSTSLKVDIVKQGGVKIKTLYSSNLVKNPDPFNWDGRDASDNLVQDGQYFVYIYLSGDLSDNQETITVDNTPPTGSVTYSSETPTNQDVTSTLTTSEDVTVTSESGSVYHTFVENGTFEYKFEDQAGNTGTKIAEVSNIDKVAPLRPTINPTTSPVNSETQIISGTAEVGSVVEIAYGTDSQTIIASDGTFSFIVPLLQNQTNNFSITATDSVNNKSEAALVVIVEDSTNPIITITKKPDTDSANVEYLVTIDYGDAEVKKFILDDGDLLDYTDPIVVTSLGLHKIRAIGIDSAENISESSAEFTIFEQVLTDPNFNATAVTENGQKSVKVEWDGVGGGVDGYDINVDGVWIFEAAQNLTNDTGVKYSKSVGVNKYGTLNVLVVAKKGTLKSANTTYKTVSFSAPAPVVNPTPTTPVTTNTPAVSVAPERAQAAVNPPAPSTESSIETPSDDNGKIKSEETSSEEEDINWTPWIVLFVLILLAGAATGGYFYWFAGTEEEEERPVVTEVKKSPKKSKGSPKSGNRKAKRW